MSKTVLVLSTSLQNLSLVLAFLFLYSEVQAQSLTRIENLELSGSDLNTGGGTSLATYRDYIYMAWIEGNTLKVSKTSSDGSRSVTTIRENIQDNLFHVMPSLAVDKDGYIHVTADMHNQDWVYYISDGSNSIRSFTQYLPGDARCPGGNTITYPQFFKDNHDELYLAYRQKVKDDGHEPGEMGGAVARYNRKDRNWTMLGGTAHDGAKTLVWANGGTRNRNGRGGWYQKPSIRLFWDSSNRMHLATTMAVEPHPERTFNGMTDLLYAYSDDGGATWKKAGGEDITSLPLAPYNASVVATRPDQRDMISGARVVAFTKDRPMIAYTVGQGEATQQHLKYWNGSSWLEMDAPYKSTELYGRRNGEVIIFRPFSGLYITTDQGASWKHMPSAPSAYNGKSEQVDYEHYITTGDFRWRTVEKTTKDVIVYTYDRDEPDEPTISPDPTGEIQISAKGQCGSERIQLLVDDQPVAEYVLGQDANVYRYTSFQGNQNIKVAFINDDTDGCDRNVYIDWIKVCNARYETEEVATRTGCGNSQWLYCEGNFDFGSQSCTGETNTSVNASAAEVILYPNPSGTEEVTIQGEGIFSFQIHDIHGKLILAKNKVPRHTTISPYLLPQGVYVITVFNQATGDTQVLKLVRD